MRAWIKDSLILKKIFFVKQQTTPLALLKYSSGIITLVNALHNNYPGDLSFWVAPKIKFKLLETKVIGSIAPLSYLKDSTVFSSFSGSKHKKGIYARAAGTYCYLLVKLEEMSKALIILPSGLRKFVHISTLVILGRNANVRHNLNVVGYAGIKRRAGIKQVVRGVARNPVDHPNGGRTKTNQPEKSIWGWIAKKNK